MTGKEGALSRRATMIAVNRKRPPKGPKPQAFIEAKADYYKKCNVTVIWDSDTPGGRYFYKLYRATDSAIYTRDLEQRRNKQGYYQAKANQDVFIKDDPDFTDWLRTIDPPD